jgi:ATP-dependent exoDNAse (exonuclease V) alpha subunit
MDSGREVEFNVRQHPDLDYGYAVTSHSSQGQTLTGCSSPLRSDR